MEARQMNSKKGKPFTIENTKMIFHVNNKE